MKKLIYLFSILLIFSCSNDEFFDTNVSELSLNSSTSSGVEIAINTTRDAWNMLETPKESGKTRSSSDPFTEIRDVESTESVVLPELVPHIWVGNIMKKSSIADCIYQPLIYPRSSINVGLTLQGTTPKTITNPTSLNY